MGTQHGEGSCLSWSSAVLCTGFMQCMRRGGVWLTTLLWLEITLLAKIGAWTHILSPNLIAFENLVLTDKPLPNSLFCKHEYLPTAARLQFILRCRTWCRSVACWDWEELLSEQKYQLCSLDGIDYYACILKMVVSVYLPPLLSDFFFSPFIM